MTDSAVASQVDIWASHNYDNGNLTAVSNAGGKSIWETEVSTFDSFDPSISNGLNWAARIHQALTGPAQVSGWHYWWLISNNSDNEGLTDSSGNPAKRMYVLGNYSKFIRPGFYRIGITNTGSILVSAYKDPSTGNFVIVAVNQSSSSSSQSFALNGFSAATVTPWITSSTLSLAQQTAVSLNSGTFSYTLPASSVVSLVGQSTSGAVTTTDTMPPSIPTGLAASAVSASQINLSWTVSTDDVGVAGYRVYRNGSQVGAATGTTYDDTGLAASTTYSYTVSAYDAAGNNSAQSSAVLATTNGTVITSAPVITSFTSSSSLLTGGQSATLSWAVTGSPAPTLTINGTAVTGSSMTVSPAQTTTYTLTATNSAGSTSSQTTVTVSATTSSSTAASGAPVLFFSDLDSGPKTGGENNNGVYVTLYGNFLGSNPTVTVGGGQAVIKLQPSTYLWYEKMTIQLGPNAQTGNIVVTNSTGSSNGLPFSVRSGNIYFVSTSGSDSNNGAFATPWLTIPKANNAMAPGDTTYIENGVVQNTVDNYSCDLAMSGTSTAGNPIALVAYPGATATIGATTQMCALRNPQVGVTPKAYYTIAGLTLRGSNAMDLWNADHWRIVGNDLSCPNGSGQSACLHTDTSTYLYVYGNNVHDVGDTAGVIDKYYHGVYFTTNSNHIWLGWNQVVNNPNGSTTSGGCRAVQFYSTGGNDQYDLHVHDNLIHDAICDGINFSTTNPNAGTVEAYNNVVYHTGTGPDPGDGSSNYTCIYVNGYSNSTVPAQIYNNTLYDCGSRGTSASGAIAAGIPTNFSNNLIQQTASENYIQPDTNSGCTASSGGTHNIWYGGIGSAPSCTSSNITSNPLLASPAGGNLTLQSASPAIDAGVAKSGLLTDFNGTPRPQGTAIDIGAFEYGQGSTQVVPTCNITVQSAMNQVLGIEPCTTANLAYDNCTVVDVQRVINYQISPTNGCKIGQ